MKLDRYHPRPPGFAGFRPPHSLGLMR